MYQHYFYTVYKKLIQIIIVNRITVRIILFKVKQNGSQAKQVDQE